jgi:hypothetical protein
MGAMMRIVGHIVFSGGLKVPPNPDAAEIDLCRAGYMVARPPAAIQARIALRAACPGDDFMQAYIDVAGVVDELRIADTIMDEINEIVAGYGGACMECGAEPPDYRPAFDDLFKACPRSH